ncbi:hypothetical protein GCM10025864_17350 [Luteimicrobium album]|uniref:Uncharacterized protein n=1 Tax=Luteimicrobium album TaxID=1054550 RepID=A0ABQ6HZV2_9MICO|nr:hypothetical protein [Luteimicrobium album]GMA23976.1 hypothetical protein GCM10025864_17350 [Luteimicrobium album]
MTLDLLVAQLDYVASLEGPPRGDTATLKLVRQSRRYDVWRLSHPFREQMGDAFYDSVGARADQIIDRWLREGEGRR